jgi:hypothetical protein
VAPAPREGRAIFLFSLSLFPAIEQQWGAIGGNHLLSMALLTPGRPIRRRHRGARHGRRRELVVTFDT